MEDKETIFNDLYEKYLVKIRKYVYYRLKNKSGLAEDILQSGFLLMYIHIDKIKGYKEEHQRRYIYSIFHRKIIDSVRNRNSILRINGKYSKHLIDTKKNVFFADSKKESFESKKELLHNAIDKLKPLQKNVIIDFYYKNLTCQEISEQRKMPLGTVDSMIFRGRQKIMELV